MKKQIAWSVIILLIVLIFIAIGVKNNHQNSSKNPIKIGGLFGLTGYAAFAGEASRDGFLMAMEDSALDVPYVVEDFHSDQKTLVTAANKLINSDKVSAIIGPEWLEFGEAIAPIANEKKMLFLSPWMTGEPDWLDSPYYFSATPSERVMEDKQIDYMITHGVKKIALAFHNNAWSLGNIKMLKDEIAKTNQIQIVGEHVFDPSETDFRTELKKIDNEKPNAIYAAFADDSGQGIFSKEMKELGLQYQIYVPVSVGTNSILRSRFGEYLTGIIYPVPQDYKNAPKFEQKFEAKYGKKPGAISAATAYDMTTLVLNAIKAGATDTESIRKYVKNVKDYDGYSNLINFNAKGQVTTESVILKQITSTLDKTLN